jgi:hypothetical protein
MAAPPLSFIYSLLSFVGCSFGNKHKVTKSLTTALMHVKCIHDICSLLAHISFIYQLYYIYWDVAPYLLPKAETPVIMCHSLDQ